MHMPMYSTHLKIFNQSSQVRVLYIGVSKKGINSASFISKKGINSVCFAPMNPSDLTTVG